MIDAADAFRDLVARMRERQRERDDRRLRTSRSDELARDLEREVDEAIRRGNVQKLIDVVRR